MDPWAGLDFQEVTSCLPESDRKALAGFASVSEIQAWASARADEYRKFALDLLSIHNYVAPIHRLSTEVLEKVLVQCGGKHEGSRLPQVCRKWHEILFNLVPAHPFWADTIADWECIGEKTIVWSEVPYFNTLAERTGCRSSRLCSPTSPSCQSTLCIKTIPILCSRG